MMDSQVNGLGRPSRKTIPLSADVFEPSSISNAKNRASLIKWINSLLPSFRLPVNASDEELRPFLVDGSVLCQLLNKLKPGSVTEVNPPPISKSFSAMDVMGLPRFQKVDLEKGSMKIVLDCLLTLKTHFMSVIVVANSSQREQLSQGNSSDERLKVTLDSKFHPGLHSPIISEPSSPLRYHAGNKHQEVFQPKQGGHADIPASRISEMMKSTNFDVYAKVFVSI